MEGNFYANYGTVILDGAEVRIGDGVMFGPGYVPRNMVQRNDGVYTQYLAEFKLASAHCVSIATWC